MTYEELKAALTADNSLLLKLKEDFAFRDDSDLEGLLNNQKNLKSEKMKFQNKLKEFGEYTPEYIQELEAKLSEIENTQGQGGDSGKNPGRGLTTQDKMRLNKLENEFGKIQKQSEFWKNKFQETKANLLIDKVLDDNKINRAFKKVLSTDFLVNSSIQIDEESGSIEMLYKSEKGEVPLADFAKEFFATEDGKIYIAKPENNGSGATTFSNRMNNSKSTVQDNIDRGRKGDPSGYISAMNQIDKQQIK